VLALEVGEEGLLGDEAQADEMRRQRAAVFALLIEGARELHGAQVAASLQEVSEPGAHGLGGRRARTLRGVRGSVKTTLPSARAMDGTGARRPVHASKASAP